MSVPFREDVTSAFSSGKMKLTPAFARVKADLKLKIDLQQFIGGTRPE